MVVTRRSLQALYWCSVSSACGECVIIATDHGICWTGTPGTRIDEGLAWVRRWWSVECLIEGEATASLRLAANELRRYLSGEHVQFSCPLDLRGTPFQLMVWKELCRIPYGETRSYKDIAWTIGRPTASRAVGAANGANPIAIIVPCHRVVGSDSSLTGYGGGLSTKSWLLALERARSEHQALSR
jgi:O-6-methylguanine DNA methyltransferase